MIKHKEIILVRAMGSDVDRVVNEVNTILLEFSRAESHLKIELYRSLSLPTDISVHIDYYEEKKRSVRYVICQRLAEILKQFGFVNHSIWTKEKPL